MMNCPQKVNNQSSVSTAVVLIYISVLYSIIITIV